MKKIKIKIEIEIPEDTGYNEENILEEIEDYCWSMDNQILNSDVKNVSCWEDTPKP